jgi:hypothetical protein
VLLPASEAERATRHPIAVMIDDLSPARPQSGLSTADIVYHAPAEGGIPRYMALYQAGDADEVGPVRSTRRYYIGWAAEWNALLAHVGGSPDALEYLRQVDGELVYDADEYVYGGSAGYFRRIRRRVPPHNTYTSTDLLRQLGEERGATAPFETPAWEFTDEAATDERPTSGDLVVPHLANRVEYAYEPETNRYLRSVSAEGRQTDAANGERIAPANVVVLFMKVRRLENTAETGNNIRKGRLDLQYLGSGRALVFRNGEVVEARWSKPDDASSTRLGEVAGPRAGMPVQLVRGQIFIQIVSNATEVLVDGKPENGRRSAGIGG